MRAGVCFVPQSFDFLLAEEDIAVALRTCSSLISKMHCKFVSFYKSSDFDTDAATQLYLRGADMGVMMKMLYDVGPMAKVEASQINSSELIEIANDPIPSCSDIWVSIYSSEKQTSLTPKSPQNTIYEEEGLVDFCSKVLVKNPRPHSDYADIFKDIYKNLLFLNFPEHPKFKTFDSISKIEGGYANFIEGITKCLSYFNAYTIIIGDAHKNIKMMDIELDFSVTSEGGGKNKRKIKALKRDFLVDGTKYTDVNCEFHYKLEYADDTNGKGKYYFNRIYFGFFNRIDPENPKIAIAHIGEHL